MPTFMYKAAVNGAVVEKTTVAKDRYTLQEDLKKAGTELISIHEVKEKKWNFKDLNNLLATVKLREKIIFARNLAAMVEAGLPMSRALSVLRRQTKNAKMQKMLDEFAQNIESGNTLSSGLAKYPKIFPELFVAMVRAGEQSGTLPQSLEVVGNQLEKSYNMRKKITGAMIYPSIVISAMVVIGILMFIFVVPTLTSTFSSLGAQLPASTRMIIAVSNFLAKDTVLALGLIIAVIIGVFLFFRTERGKRTYHFCVLYVPVIKNIVKESNAAYMSRTFSSLLASGVEVIEALKITRQVVPNVYFRKVIDEAIICVEKGEPIHQAFAEHDNLFPLLVGEMMEVGEETGQLIKMLERLAIFYEGEVEIATKDMSTIIEPILMLVIASAVGFFAVSMITPIYSLSNSI
ncbi:MAG TPA: type II secretion system F family protein [Candidatus Paceibacterota bacterium]|nr:type II secretion system F family protein [Candidatus Paceibacterota bacterium]